MPLALSSRIDASRRLVLIVALVSVALVGGCGGDDDAASAASQVEDVTAGVERFLDRLEQSLADARPRSRASMVDLRAAADRAAGDLDDAQDDLRDIPATSAEDRELVRQAEDALEELASLASAMSATAPSVTRIEQAAAQARLAVDDLEQVRLPEIDTTAYVAALRAARRRRAADQAQTGQPSAPVGPSSSSSSAASEPGYRDYVGPAFQAKLPTGSGWGSPSQSEPTPGQLYRTSVRGPDGLFVIVDYTPFETAKFGGNAQSTEVVGQTAFGAATKYVFRGGRLPECQRSPCVDYIINDASSGEGFAVLAGGGSTTTAAAIARTVAESVTPVG